jgi:hypothetical protein
MLYDKKKSIVYTSTMASTEVEALKCVSPTVNTAETRYLEDDYSIVLLYYD